MHAALLLFFLVSSASYSSAQNRHLYENDRCNPNDSTHTCKKLKECPSGVISIKSGRNPIICSFDGLEPIVCCEPQKDPGSDTSGQQQNNRPGLPNQQQNNRPGLPNQQQNNSPSLPNQQQNNNPSLPNQQQNNRPSLPNQQQNNRPINSSSNGTLISKPVSSKSQQKCREYAEFVFRVEESPVPLPNAEPITEDYCGRIEKTLIVGGENATVREFPHMALIGYRDPPRWGCGGSLISEQYIISAAHCSNPKSLGPARWAKLGDILTTQRSDFSEPVMVKIVERLNHPDYHPVQLYNDIALYKLERALVLGPYVRPICLQAEHQPSSQTAIASGWGHTKWGGRGSEVLQKVTLDLVDTRKCNTSYRGDITPQQLSKGILEESMMCAGGEGKDTCQGDSGGPLQTTLDDPYCMYSLVGVTSFGKDCGSNVPGVYTRVSNYIPWIEGIVWP